MAPHIPDLFNPDELTVSCLLCTAGFIPCSEVPFFFFFLNSAVLNYSTNDLHGNQSYPKNATKLCKPTPSFQLQIIYFALCGWVHRNMKALKGWFNQFSISAFYLFIHLIVYAVIPILLFNLT